MFLASNIYKIHNPRVGHPYSENPLCGANINNKKIYFFVSKDFTLDSNATYKITYALSSKKTISDISGTYDAYEVNTIEKQ